VPPLTLRELNRALLARQLLLARSPLPALAAVRQLVALQAQVANPPYLGLWTRLESFAAADLTGLLTSRQVVRATLLRATLHLVEAADFLRWRPLLAPATARAMRGFMGKRIAGLDGERLAAVTREILREAPQTYGRIGALLEPHFPGYDATTLAYSAYRHHLPVVQVPPGGTWNSRPADATYLPADDLLDRPLEVGADPAELVRRYLAAFGPATVADAQRWSGLTGLAAVVRRMPDLVALPTADGPEILDLPDAPRPPADTPAPPRFVPDYDNLILGHADRRRVIADADRPRVSVSGGGRVLGTVLLDGFVAGTWKIDRAKGRATLLVTPFGPVAAADRAALEAEGAGLLAFAAPDAIPEVRCGDPA
jgi:hypothetical protein